jgi:uncharacterized protein (DUF433 family)
MAYDPNKDWRDRITVDPNVSFGKPCVKGTRFAVVHVLEYLAGGESFDDMLENFPQLTREDLMACIAWANEREKQSYARREFALGREPVPSVATGSAEHVP